MTQRRPPGGLRPGGVRKLRTGCTKTPEYSAKWFAAAKEAGLYDEAVGLASSGPCDPKTLTRAARDFAQKEPGFSVEIGLLALRWLADGYGYEVTSVDVWSAYTHTMRAAFNRGCPEETLKRLREIVVGEAAGGFVRSVLGRELGL